MSKAAHTAGNCQQMRRKLVQRYTLDIATDTRTPVGAEWVTEPCGSPLFGARSRAIGKCPSCEGGWTHPNNYPVEDSAIAAAKGGAA